MSDDKNKRDEFKFDNFDDDFDNFKYDDYDNYDDEKPLTSSDSEKSPRRYDDEAPIEREDKKRPSSRRETIERVAEEVQNGIPRKPGVTAPDERISAAYQGRRPDGQRRAQYRPRTAAERTPQKKGGNSKAVFTGFYIAFLMLAIGLVLVLLIFAIGRSGDLLQNIPFAGCADPVAPYVPQATADPHVPVDLRNQTALITGIGIDGARTLTLMDITTHQTNDFNVPDEARTTDRGGGPLAFQDLRVGTIVDISYDARTARITTLRESPQARTLSGRRNIRVNMDDFTIAHGNEAWDFNSQTLVRYRGEDFAISRISPIDSITLVVHGTTVWLVQVETSHGFLQFTNADMVVNGRVMINHDEFLALDEIEGDIDLSEGTHRLMIEGDNIEPFIDEIIINPGQTTRFNLGELPLRVAILHISVTPEDAQIFINGEEHENTEPAQVEFGENLVRVEREGFLPQEQQLDIETPINHLFFDLVEIVHDSTLVIFTVPTNAEIFINNVFAGHSTLTHTVAPGTHTIIARRTGYNDARVDIIVTGHETEDIMRSLILLPATGDPLDNMHPHDVDPIHTPFPTLPPVQNNDDPFPTLPPVQSPQPTLPPLPFPTPFPPPGGDNNLPDPDSPAWIF